MFRNRPLASLAAVMSSIAMVTAISSSAHAALENNFNIAGSVSNGGSGEAFGELTFFPYSPYRDFRVAGNVRDICPADGYGMELQIRIRMTNGIFFSRGDVIEDLNGCGNGYEQLNPPQDFLAPNPIDAGQAQLFATENGSPLIKIAASTFKEHPYT